MIDILLKYFSEFSEKQVQQFTALQSLYTDWNSKINVISRKDIDSLYEKHVLHSLSIAAVVAFEDGTEVIDIGTGGGFPGIPLAIFFPDVQFLLVDSIGKKLKVVEGVAEALELTNVTTRHTRAEEIKNQKFDFAMSRAVAPLKELWQWSKPLIRKGHKHDIGNGLICLKGGDLTKEIFESGTRPNIVSIQSIFYEESFKDKHLLHVPLK